MQEKTLNLRGETGAQGIAFARDFGTDVRISVGDPATHALKQAEDAVGRCCVYPGAAGQLIGRYRRRSNY